MTYKNINLTSKYIAGYVFDTYSLRKYKKTIKSTCKLNGKVFYCEVVTERDETGRYGFGKSFYYKDENSKIYKSIKWMLKSLNK